MRRFLIAAAAAAVIVVVLPMRQAVAACEAPPRRESRAGARLIRNTPLVAWGVIDRGVPKNAHGGFSFFLEVRTYFRGAGPSTLEVTDYGDREIALAGLRPGGSVDPSRSFIDRHAGEQAVVFASPEKEPFLGGYATDRCTYTSYGGAVAGIVRNLRRTLGPGRAPAGLPLTGDPLVGLAGIGAALVIAGELMRRAGRRAEGKDLARDRGRAAIARPVSALGADSARSVLSGLIGPNLGPFPRRSSPESGDAPRHPSIRRAPASWLSATRASPAPRE